MVYLSVTVNSVTVDSMTKNVSGMLRALEDDRCRWFLGRSSEFFGCRPTRSCFLLVASPLLPYLFDDFATYQSVQAGAGLEEPRIDVFVGQVGFMTIP